MTTPNTDLLIQKAASKDVSDITRQINNIITDLKDFKELHTENGSQDNNLWDFYHHFDGWPCPSFLLSSIAWNFIMAQHKLMVPQNLVFIKFKLFFLGKLLFECLPIY